MTDLALMIMAKKIGDRADAMYKRGLHLNDRKEESLLFAFDVAETLDILGARIDAEKQKKNNKLA